MKDYYTESEVNRIEQIAYEGAMLEAGKEWERQRDESNFREHELEDRIAELETLVAELEARLAELEEQLRWIPVSERLPEEEGWYYAGVLGRFGDHYTHDVYFYAEDITFRWKDCEGDKVYCWLDGVPELPEPSEVQE